MFSSESENRPNAIDYRSVNANTVCDTPPMSRSPTRSTFDVATSTNPSAATMSNGNDEALTPTGPPVVTVKPRSINKLIQQSRETPRNLSPITEISEHMVQSSLSDTPKRGRSDLLADMDGE